MNVYVILKDFDEKTFYIRKFWSEEDWDYLKKYFKPEHIMYVTLDLDDPEIKKYNLKKIVWTRIKNSYSGKWIPISVPLSDNVEEMEEAARTETSRVQKELNAWIKEKKAKNEKKE